MGQLVEIIWAQLQKGVDLYEFDSKLFYCTHLLAAFICDGYSECGKYYSECRVV